METGVVQFGDDWPGYFLRGDDAMNVRFVTDHLRALVDDLIRCEKAIPEAVISHVYTAYAMLATLPHFEEVDVRQQVIAEDQEALARHLEAEQFTGKIEEEPHADPRRQE